MATLTGVALSAGHGGTPAVGSLEVGAFFVVGLLGGAHCLGMCGPLVTLYADRMDGHRGRDDVLTWHQIRQHGLFNLGRTASYAAIAAVLGLLGGLVLDAPAAALGLGDSVRGAVGVAVGLLIFGSGLAYVARGRVVEVPGFGGAFERVHGVLTDHVDALVDGVGVAGLGAVHGFLPCPILYPGFLYAFARADPVAAALAMGALGLGTIPSLFLYGTVLSSAPPRFRQRMHRALGLAFLALAYVPLSHGLMQFGVQLPHVGLPVPWPA